MLELNDYFTRLADGPATAFAGPPVELTGRADDNGWFRLRLPPGRTYWAIAYPPPGAALLRRASELVWADGEAERDLTLRLPPGIPVAGRVAEEDGRPVPGASVYYFGHAGTAEDPSSETDQVQFRDTATMTGPDGRFALVVPPGNCRVEAFGPTPDYRPQDDSFLLCPTCGVHHVRSYAHARAALKLDLGEQPEPLAFGIRHGVSVTARVVCPDGEPVAAGVAVTRCVVHPLRRKVPRTLPIRDGVLTLPGCAPDRTYPVLFLDPARQLAAVAELSVRPADEPPPTVRLAPCGTAVVRLTDAVGRPIAGERPLVRFWIGHDRPADEPEKTDDRLRPLPVYPSWVDPAHYLPGPVTDNDGRVTLPGLVPGLDYEVVFQVGPRAFRTREFRVAAGEAVRTPDVVAGPEEAGGHGGGDR
jgi:hypothetical protein